MNAIYTWLLLTAALLVIEAMTAGLTTIWFAGGAVAALVLAFLGMPVWIQTGAFAAVSLVLLLITRPLALKYMKKSRWTASTGWQDLSTTTRSLKRERSLWSAPFRVLN